MSKEDKKDQELLKIKKIIEDCQQGLWNSGIGHVNGVYSVGKFEVKSPPMYPGHTIWNFKYSETGSENEVSFNSFEDHYTFSLIKKDREITVSNRSFLMISELVKIDPAQTGFYPNIEFTWVGEDSEGLDKGDLKSLRVNFSESMYVTYFRMSSIKYGIYNSQNVDLDKLELPGNLNRVSEILEVPFKKWIDFDVRNSKLFDNSNLQELSDEIDQLI